MVGVTQAAENFWPTHPPGPQRFCPPVLFPALRCGQKLAALCGYCRSAVPPTPTAAPARGRFRRCLVPRRRRSAAPRSLVAFSSLVCFAAPSLPRRRKLVGPAPRAAGADWSYPSGACLRSPNSPAVPLGRGLQRLWALTASGRFRLRRTAHRADAYIGRRAPVGALPPNPAGGDFPRAPPIKPPPVAPPLRLRSLPACGAMSSGGPE